MINIIINFQIKKINVNMRCNPTDDLTIDRITVTITNKYCNFILSNIKCFEKLK
jgi:hypothetical protein